MSSQVQIRHNGEATSEIRAWRDSARIFLQPIAAPSILGLFGFAGATFMVAAHQAEWFGNAQSPTFLFPFAATFGGLAQLLAGMWAYRARDGVATAAHGTWGAFWLGYGVLNLLVATGDLTLPGGGKFVELGYWFLVLAAITTSIAIASLGESVGLFAVLTTLAVGSAFSAIGFLTSGTGWEQVGGWVLIASAVIAWYVATAMLLASSWGRAVLPLGKIDKSANVPGGEPVHPIEFHYGEPGVKQGQ
jgi:succinate-acetate transporter protein